MQKYFFPVPSRTNNKIALNAKVRSDGNKESIFQSKMLLILLVYGVVIAQQMLVVEL